MTHELLTLPRAALERLRNELRMGFLEAPYSEAALRPVVGEKHLAATVAGLDRLARGGIAGEGVSTWIEDMQAVQRDVPQPSLVWTGPEVSGLPSRDTRQVFDELIRRAEKTLWVSTYAYFDGKNAFETLAKRMDTVPTLEVTVLLNVEWKSHHASADEAVRKAASSLWSYNWPGARRPRVFYFPESLKEDRSERAVLHAKAIVRDEREALVTSANFTKSALDKNIELGVLLDDRAFAQQVIRHYQRLIEERRLVMLPTK